MKLEICFAFSNRRFLFGDSPESCFTVLIFSKKIKIYDYEINTGQTICHKRKKGNTDCDAKKKLISN